MPHSRFRRNTRWDDLWPTVGEPNLLNENIPVRFSIMSRGHDCEVFRNGTFWGVFVSRLEALTKVNAAMNEVFAGGGAAQVRFV